MDQVHCTEFHRFPNLPPELRRAIWNHAIQEPQVVETYGFLDRETGICTHIGDKLHVFPKFPPIWSVCHEARKAFVESPGLVSEKTGLGVAWHPERDVLKCQSITGYPTIRSDDCWEWSWWDEIGCASYGIYSSSPGLSGRRDVQNIQLDLSDLSYAYPFLRRRLVHDGGMFKSGDGASRDIRGRFPNVKTVELVADGEFRSPPGEHRLFEVTLNFPPGPIDFSHAWDLIKGLRDGWHQGLSLNIVGRVVCRI
ncbi:hypothetical protein PG985_009689 [Apiospora marii]|uniref:2EXR domain-containing protein n=1 Tax=Apiospora marii TaxID=335849 RepID=A0ABR1RG21_9PEZI